MFNEPWVRITFTTQENEVTAHEKALQEQLNAAVNNAVEQYMQKSRLQDVVEIELYPCDDDCEECQAA